MNHPLHIAALIVAAGEGLRMGGTTPKAYLPLHNKPLIEHSIDTLLAHSAINHILVVHHKDHAEYIANLRIKYPTLLFTEGGSTRQESVKNGLEFLSAHKPPTHILIHDAARPYIDLPLIDRIIAPLQSGAKSVLAAIPVKDTIKQILPEGAIHTPDRQQLYLAQTPQGFDFETIHRLHKLYAEKSATDDAMLAEWAGIPTEMVEGSQANHKITYREDMKSEHTPPSPQYRIGQGFDVHAFSTEEATGSITLCGVLVPCNANLIGHSDGDVGIHALVDALLGALAMGDIGQHFPPSDNQWKNADSRIFLQHACKLMAERGASLVNADITIISEKPKVSLHREAMQQRLAEIMGVEISRVSVKATTTEKLGFTGREEGIAAQAIVMLAVHD